MDFLTEGLGKGGGDVAGPVVAKVLDTAQGELPKALAPQYFWLEDLGWIHPPSGFYYHDGYLFGLLLEDKADIYSRTNMNTIACDHVPLVVTRDKCEPFGDVSPCLRGGNRWGGIEICVIRPRI